MLINMSWLLHVIHSVISGNSQVIFAAAGVTAFGNALSSHTEHYSFHHRKLKVPYGKFDTLLLLFHFVKVHLKNISL